MHDSLKARRALVDGLEKLLSTNKSAIEKEEVSWKEFGARKSAIEQKKREVEDGIMRGLSGGGDGTTGAGAGMSPLSPMRGGAGDPRMNGATAAGSPGAEPDRPDVEELTPPPEEAPATTTGTTTAAASSTFEPTPGSSEQPRQDPRMRNQALTPDIVQLQQQQQSLNGLLPPTYIQQQASHSVTPQPPPPPQHPQLGADLLSSLNLPPVRQYSGSPPGAAPASKKRKMDDDEAGAVFGSAAGQGEEGDVMAGLDDDVAELLRQESGSGR